MIGTRLGSYEITAKLGEGGMGEVYRATDTKLKREVAIKVLPAAFTEDKERLARFEREAQLLAQLHHPNIASIFGLEDSDGTRALVMELVDGPTLADRLGTGPLPLQESVSIALQIAQALEEAHERGIVHRDLKPQNIKASLDGKVKVLDFGLAKAMDPAGSTSAADLARAPTLLQSPTLTAIQGTQLGAILGTAAYMSPEQARGRPVDKRADIWAFGAVLFEMLTGRRPFDGDTVSDVLAAVLTREPDWSALPAATPAAVVRLLRRCLERDPKQRLHDIADARLELAGAAEPPANVAPARSALASRGGMFWAGWAVAAAALLLAGTLAIRLAGRASSRDAGGESVQRLQFVPPKGERLDLNGFHMLRGFAISPDGSKIVYTVQNGATSALRLRSLDSEVSTAIPGTEGGTNPFFSPDGKWIAFAAEPKLKKVALAGGTPVTLADAPIFRGGVWGDDGAIRFVPNVYVPIASVPAEGGAVRPITKIRTEEGELQHRWPELLPGSKALLYAVGYGADWDEATIVAERFDTGERKTLVKGGTNPRFLSTGQLVYARAGGLYAVDFDSRSLSVSGPAVEVARNVFLHPTGFAQVDLSRAGMLVSAPADSVAGASILSWVDREGRGAPLGLAPANYRGVSLSPAAERVALQIGNGISVLDFARLSMRKLELARRAENPTWSRDGREVLFGYEQGKSYQVHAKSADDSGVPRLVIPSEEQEDPRQVSRDGSRLLALRARKSGLIQLLVYDLGDSKGSPKILVESPYMATTGGTFSPDGRWVVYQSTESGRPEIYVRPASGEDRKWQVSVEGGIGPIWSPAGDEIFWLCGSKFIATPVSAKGSEFLAGAPRLLFKNHEITAYDVAPDGKRFLVAEDPNPGAQTRLDVVVHWFTAVRRKLAEAKTP